MNCGSCKHLIENETSKGEAFTECAIMKCPLEIRKAAFNEAADIIRAAIAHNWGFKGRGKGLLDVFRELKKASEAI